MFNSSWIFLILTMLSQLNATIESVINEVLNEYATINHGGNGYHYEPPYLAFDIESAHDSQESHRVADEPPAFSYNNIDDNDHQYFIRYPTSDTSDSYIKSPPLVYFLSSKQGPKEKENVASISTLQMPLTSRPASGISFIKALSILTNRTSSSSQLRLDRLKMNEMFNFPKPITTGAALKQKPLRQSPKSKVKYATKKFVNLQLPLSHDVLPLNVPQLPLQSGASYATLSRHRTSYDQPPYAS